MFHVKDDFRAGAPFTQVGAAWFNKVGSFLNNLVGGRGVRIVKNESGPSYVELEDGGAVPSSDAGEPEDRTDAPTAYDETGETWEWAAGGENGLTLDCYCKVAPQTTTSNYTVFQRCRMVFSKDGLLISGKLLSDRIRIQAKNA